MSGLKCLARLRRAAAPVAFPHRTTAVGLARRTRHEPVFCPIEGLETRWMLDGYQPATLSASLAPTTLYQGQSVWASVSANSGAGIDPISSWTITWGDGSTSTISSVSGSASHSYGQVCSYYAYATPHGSGCVTYTYPSWCVTVSDSPPPLTPACISFSAGSANINEGECVTLGVCATYGAGIDPISSWTITWGDGSTDTISGAGGSASHKYDDGPTTYSAQATPIGSGCFTYSPCIFNVSVANVAPTASVSFGAVTIDEGSCVSVSLDGSDPSCADMAAGLLYSFAVDGPPGSYEIAPAGNCATISFYDNGSFTVHATVTDKDGGSSQYTLKAVTANNVAPTGCFSVNPTTLDEGGSVAACVTDAYDPSCVDLEYGLHYSFAVDSGSLASSWSAADTPSGTCLTFNDNGSFTVYGRILDKDNGSTTYSVSGITVNNVAPTGCFTLGSTSPNEGDSVTMGFSSESDPSSADVSGGFHYSYAIDNPSLLAGAYSDATDGESVSITFPDDGSHTIYGRIFDKDGGYSDYSQSVCVSNVAPTVTVTADPTKAYQGDIITASFSATDPGDDTITSWQIDWAEGGDPEIVSAGSSGSASHMYSSLGSKTITASPCDEDSAPGFHPGASTNVEIVGRTPLLSEELIPNDTDDFPELVGERVHDHHLSRSSL